MTLDITSREWPAESDSESDDDYLWLTRPCRHSRERSGDCLQRQLQHRGTSSLRSQGASRSRSAPPSSLTPNYHFNSLVLARGGLSYLKTMLTAATAVDLTFDDDEWVAPQPAKLYRAASVGNSWGVTSFGRGFNWKAADDERESEPRLHIETQLSNAQGPSGVGSQPGILAKTRSAWASSPTMSRGPSNTASPVVSVAPLPPSAALGGFASGPLSRSPVQSRCSSPKLLSPVGSSGSLGLSRSPILSTPSSPRLGNATAPHSRRRSSHQRVSLIAGRVSIVPSQPPSPPPTAPMKLVRANSAASFLSVASSTGPPTPGIDRTPSVGERSISEFVIEGEIGRGAYGLVKRAREMNLDGTLGVSRIFTWSALVPFTQFSPASPHYQTDHKITHLGRLLEETSEVRHDSY
jgi:protein-serine/threonine kinase